MRGAVGHAICVTRWRRLRVEEKQWKGKAADMRGRAVSGCGGSGTDESVARALARLGCSSAEQAGFLSSSLLFSLSFSIFT